MPCTRPLEGWRSAPVEGKRGGFTMKPQLGNRDQPMTVPCGYCMGCRLEKSRQWAVRLMHENQMHSASCFLTLTYSDQNLPLHNSLNPKHFQDFMKRLRKKLIYSNISTGSNVQTTAKSPGDRPGVHPRTPIIEAGLHQQAKFLESRPSLRYYHCGEYGSQLGRPHYHALLFGHRPEDGKLFSEKNGVKLYEAPELTEIWGHGFVTFGDVTFESAAYVARYITKKITGEKSAEHYTRITEQGEVIQLHPEYATMSRKPGIGAAWVAKYGEYTYTHDHVIVRGKPSKPPRFYDTAAEQQFPEQFKAAKLRRLKKSREQSPENRDPEIRVDQRRRANEAITKARMIARKGDF